jgi:hypothetical protein
LGFDSLHFASSERGRVLELQPMARAARAIGRAEAFAHDAFKAELASVAKYDVAGLVDVLVEMQRPGGPL